MALFWSPRSPYARKVTIAAHETGAISDIELKPTVVMSMQPSEALMALNPLNQIPTLISRAGAPIYDSAAIIHHLDVELGDGRLHPAEPAARTRMLRLHAIGDGLIWLFLTWLTERSRQQPDQSPARIAAIAKKLPFVFAALDGEAEAMTAEPFDASHIAIVAALAYGDFRFAADWPWRPRYQRLARWFAAVSERPSVRDTAFFDELAAQRGEAPANPVKGK